MSDEEEVLDMNLLEAQATREPEPEPEAVNEQQPEVPQIPEPKESAVDWLYCATPYLRMYDELKQFHVARGHPPAEVLKQMGIFKATCNAELRRVYNLPLYLDEELDLNERKVWRQKLLRLYKLRILPWVCKLDYEEAEKILKGELLNETAATFDPRSGCPTPPPEYRNPSGSVNMQDIDLPDSGQDFSIQPNPAGQGAEIGSKEHEDFAVLNAPNDYHQPCDAQDRPEEKVTQAQYQQRGCYEEAEYANQESRNPPPVPAHGAWSSGQHLASATANNIAAPLVLVSFPDGKIEFHEDVAKRTFASPAYRGKKISLVSVMGPSRSGKSFFISLMINGLQAGPGHRKVVSGFFKSGYERHTEGILIFEKPAFAGSDENHLIFYIDTQGTFDLETERSTSLWIAGFSFLLADIQIVNLRSNIGGDNLHDIHTFTEVAAACNTNSLAKKIVSFLEKDAPTLTTSVEVIKEASITVTVNRAFEMFQAALKGVTLDHFDNGVLAGKKNADRKLKESLPAKLLEEARKGLAGKVEPAIKAKREELLKIESEKQALGKLDEIVLDWRKRIQMINKYEEAVRLLESTEISDSFARNFPNLSCKDQVSLLKNTLDTRIANLRGQYLRQKLDETERQFRDFIMNKKWDPLPTVDFLHQEAIGALQKMHENLLESAKDDGKKYCQERGVLALNEITTECLERLQKTKAAEEALKRAEEKFNEAIRFNSDERRNSAAAAPTKQSENLAKWKEEWALKLTSEDTSQVIRSSQSSLASLGVDNQAPGSFEANPAAQSSSTKARNQLATSSAVEAIYKERQIAADARLAARMEKREEEKRQQLVDPLQQKIDRQVKVFKLFVQGMKKSYPADEAGGQSKKWHNPCSLWTAKEQGKKTSADGLFKVCMVEYGRLKTELLLILQGQIEQEEIDECVNGFEHDCDEIFRSEVGRAMDDPELNYVGSEEALRKLFVMRKCVALPGETGRNKRKVLNYAKVERHFRLFLRRKLANAVECATDKDTKQGINATEELWAHFRKSLAKYDLEKLLELVINDVAVGCWLDILSIKFESYGKAEDNIVLLSQAQHRLNLRIPDKDFLQFCRTVKELYRKNAARSITWGSQVQTVETAHVAASYHRYPAITPTSVVQPIGLPCTTNSYPQQEQIYVEVPGPEAVIEQTHLHGLSSGNRWTQFWDTVSRRDADYLTDTTSPFHNGF
ncbi:unnamed protein product, partial [Mesorhabditis spiculigera]